MDGNGANRMYSEKDALGTFGRRLVRRHRRDTGDTEQARLQPVRGKARLRLDTGVRQAFTAETNLCDDPQE